VAVADTAATNERASVGFNLLANDSDPDGDALTLVGVNTSGLKGQVVVGAGGAVTYDPGVAFRSLGEGQTATEAFTYTVRDVAGNTAQGAATVRVTGVNDAPLADDDAFAIGAQDGAIDIRQQLLANDSDPDRNDTLRISEIQEVSEQGATLWISPTGEVVYAPGDLWSGLGAGETAQDTFTYTVTDARGLTSTATAVVTIRGAGDGEPSDTQLLRIAEDQVSANLVDRLFQQYGVSRVTSVTTDGLLGEVSLSADGRTLIYSAEALDQLLADTVTPTQFRWTGVTSEGVVKSGIYDVQVTGRYDPVTAVNDAVSVNDNQSTGNLWTTLLSNDIDPEGGVHQRFILGVDTTGTAGSVQFNAQTQSLIYTAPDLQPGETRTDSFRYTAHDNSRASGAETTAVVTITVTGTTSGAAVARIESSPVEDSFDFTAFSCREMEGELFEPGVFEPGGAQPPLLDSLDGHFDQTSVVQMFDVTDSFLV
jgi:VCBS repeat-containing protein